MSFNFTLSSISLLAVVATIIYFLKVKNEEKVIKQIFDYIENYKTNNNPQETKIRRLMDTHFKYIKNVLDVVEGTSHFFSHEMLLFDKFVENLNKELNLMGKIEQWSQEFLNSDSQVGIYKLVLPTGICDTCNQGFLIIYLEKSVDSKYIENYGYIHVEKFNFF